MDAPRPPPSDEDDREDRTTLDPAPEEAGEDDKTILDPRPSFETDDDEDKTEQSEPIEPTTVRPEKQPGRKP